MDNQPSNSGDVFTLPASFQRLEDLYGYFPRVTALPTWKPSRFLDSFALDTTSGVFYYYDFTNNGWKGTPKGPAGSVVGTTDTQTLTNKRINPRVETVGGAISSHAVDSDSYDMLSVSVLSTAVSLSVSGTPVNGQKLVIRILDNGTSQTLSWGSSVQNYGVILPTTTVAGKPMTLGLIYDSILTYWGCVAYVHV